MTTPAKTLAATPLLPKEDALSAYQGPAQFAWLVKGRVGGAPCPGVLQPIDQDLAALQRVGVTLAVTLTAEWQPPVELLAGYGIASLYLPIPDMGAPTLQQAGEVCRAVDLALAQGETVLFHCRAGRGRTGTMLAALLIWQGDDFDTAVDRVKTTNRHWIESSEQLLFLARFSAWCSQLRAGQDAADTTASAPSGQSRNDKDAQPEAADETIPAAATSTLQHQKGTTMSLDKALQAAMATVPECLASGYVDMDSGMLLGIQTIDSHPQEVLDTLAAATADLFQGSAVVYIEQIFKQSRGTKTDDHYFNEFLVFSSNLIHVFMRTKRYPNHVCCFVTRKTANPGMVLTKARMSLETVAAAV